MRLLLVSLFFFLAGCSITEKDETIGWSVQQLYNEAKQSMDSSSYSSARSYYNKLLARYPYGRYAQQASLDLIRLEYQDGEYDKAVAYADRFIKVYPTSPYADYARYMKGVISYSRDVSVLDRIVPTSIAQSDQKMMKDAYEDFAELAKKSPNGEYTEDAKKRMIFLRNITAEHEVYVAEYYMRRGAFLAAANRGQYIIQHYNQTPSVPLGLAIMYRSYQALNMPKLAEDAKRVLEANYADEIGKNERLDYILNGDVSRKKSFWTSIRQGLLVK